MAGTTFDIVVLSSSPPESSATALHVNCHPPRRVVAPPSLPVVFSPPVSPTRPSSGTYRVNHRAESVSEGDVRGFATVRSLVQSEHLVQPQDEQTPTIPPAQAQSRQASEKGVIPDTVPIKKPRKPRTAKTPAADGVEKPKPKPRQRKPKAQDNLLADSELRLPSSTKSPFFGDVPSESKANPPTELAQQLTKSGKPRKPRTKKEKVNEDETSTISKPKKPRATKSKVGEKTGKTSRKVAVVTSAHFQNASDQDNTEIQKSAAAVTRNSELATEDDVSLWDRPQSPQPKKKAVPKQRQPGPIVEDLDLDGPPVMRRRDWTPPRDTIVASPATDSIGKENRNSPANAEGTFTNLLSNFAYAQMPSGETPNLNTSNRGPTTITKRRRVELMDIPGHQTTSRNSSPEKGKAPKKKPRTITDLVTEKYAISEATADPDTLNRTSFDANSSTRVPLNDVSALNAETSFKKPVRRLKNSKQESEQSGAKAKIKKPSKKSVAKPKPIAEKLLSPTSALSRLDQQNVLFGTSSQLALEESPSMVRQLQQAIKESEKDASLLSRNLAAPPQWPKLKKAIGKRGLWAESARDADGGILEYKNDIYMPGPDQTQDIPLLMDGTCDQSDKSVTFIDIDDIEIHSMSIKSDDLSTSLRTAPLTSPSMKGSYGVCAVPDDVFEIMNDSHQKPPPSNQNDDSQYSFADIDDFTPPRASQSQKSAPAPKLDVPTASSIDAPPKRRRGRPPKSQPVISAVNTTSTSASNPSATKTHSTTRAPPQTPIPPTATPRFIDIDEILDSEDEALEPLSPTPSRIPKIVNLPPLPLASYDGSPIKPKNPPPTSSIPRIYLIPATHLQWPTIKPKVFSSLTTHIRSLPPSHNPAQPTWHEKILLFEPIVLEDFTEYLNANADVCVWRRATQKQIRAWNAEAKRRGEGGVVVATAAGSGVDGEERQGEGEEEMVLAVEKEIEGWMVQLWCEGLGVCCVKRVKGHGGARKGLY